MKTLKLIALLFVICFSFQTLALNLFKMPRDRYTRLTPEVDLSRLEKLLSKRRLSIRKQHELASLCLNFPSTCVNKGLFQKISPNLILESKQSFVRKIISTYEPDSDAIYLLQESLVTNNLDPHLETIFEGDLALDILSMGNTLLTDLLLNHPRFNPNQQYGENHSPLASVFLERANIDIFYKIISCKNFDNKILDKNFRRTGYYILENFEEEISRKLFLAFMGPNFNQWQMHGLGLNNAAHLDRLLSLILQNEQERLLILRKVIEQLLMAQEEKIQDNSKAFKALAELFSLSSCVGSKFYITKSLSYQVLEMLVHHRIVKELIHDGVRPYAFWAHDMPEDIGEISALSFFDARQKHIGDKQNSCSICLDDNGDKFIKASLWCEHSFCPECLLGLWENRAKNEDLRCPSQDCNSIYCPHCKESTIFIEIPK